MNYYSLLNSVEFQNWRDKALKQIYGEHYFTNVFNVDFQLLLLTLKNIFHIKILKKYIARQICFSKRNRWQS